MNLSVRHLCCLLALGLAASQSASAQGFKAEFYRGTTAGYPALPTDLASVRVVSSVAFSSTGVPGTQVWGLGAAIEGAPLTARFSSTVQLTPTGSYAFQLDGADGVLLVDGSVVADVRPGANRPRGTVTLAAGQHFLELYYSAARAGTLQLSYIPVGAASPVALPSTLCQPGVAFGSAVRTLSFDDLASGTFLTDQLVTSHGLRFLANLGDGYYYTSRPQVTSGAGVAHSGTQFLQNASHGVEAYEQISSNAPLTMTFTQPQARAAVYVGGVPTTVLPRPTAVLRAYDSTGRLVASDRVDSVTSAGISHRLEVGRGVADITTVAVDWGSSYLDERIDDLSFESLPGVPPPATDTTPPRIRIIEPVASAEIRNQLGTVPVQLTVSEESGALRSVTLTSGSVTGSLLTTSGIDPACTPPTCQGYQGGINLPQGRQTLTVVAVDAAGNRAEQSVQVVVVRQTLVHIRAEDGSNAAGAEVYVGGTLRGTTDASGNLIVAPPVARGTPVVARARVFESASPRANHSQGSTQNWNYRVYVTSLPINADGTSSPTLVGDPLATVELQLSRNNTIVGLHVTLSVEYDATLAELNHLRDAKLIPASQMLYDATDGQFLLEQVDVTDNAVNWGTADYSFFADNTLRPHVDCRTGGFLFGSIFCATTIHVRRGEV